MVFSLNFILPLRLRRKRKPKRKNNVREGALRPLPHQARSAMEDFIFEAKGKFATKLSVPILACKRCGKVTYPYPGQTQIVCKCGKLYTLMVEGEPVKKILIT